MKIPGKLYDDSVWAFFKGYNFHKNVLHDVCTIVYFFHDVYAFFFAVSLI